MRLGFEITVKKGADLGSRGRLDTRPICSGEDWAADGGSRAGGLRAVLPMSSGLPVLLSGLNMTENV